MYHVYACLRMRDLRQEDDCTARVSGGKWHLAGNACCRVNGDCFIGRAVFEIQEKIPILKDAGVSGHWHTNQIRFGYRS